jgi:hypothetical protein
MQIAIILHAVHIMCDSAKLVHLLQIIDLLCAYYTRAFLHYITLDENIRRRIEKRGLMLPHSKLHLLLYMYGLLLQRGPTIITFIERDSKQNISLICNKSFCSQLSQSESVRPSDSSTVTTTPCWMVSHRPSLFAPFSYVILIASHPL